MKMNIHTKKATVDSMDKIKSLEKYEATMKFPCSYSLRACGREFKPVTGLQIDFMAL